MAIQEKNGMLHGSAGPVVFRRWRKLTVVQARPRSMKQTAATRAAAREFGMASATARYLRVSMERVYHYADGGMANRLTCAVLKALQGAPGRERLDRDLGCANLQPLQGFEFNLHSPLYGSLPVMPQVEQEDDGGLRLRVPAFLRRELHVDAAFRQAHFFSLRCALISYNLKDRYYEVLECRDFEPDERGDMAAIDWRYGQRLPAGTVVLVSMALYASRGGSSWQIESNSVAWSPAAIIGAFATPEAAEEPRMSLPERLAYREQQGKGVILAGMGGRISPFGDAGMQALRAQLTPRRKPGEPRPVWEPPQKGRFKL